VTVRGRSGHGARPMRGGATASLGRILCALDRSRFPIHVTPVVRRMIGSAAARICGPKGLFLRLLLVPGLAAPLLALLGESGRVLEPLFRNTANVTAVRGGEKANVIPSEVQLGLDGRILPGLDVEDFLAELREVIGPAGELRILLHDPVPTDPDYGLFDTLGRILVELDPDAVPIPLLLPASTDARFFSRLGIQTYGFTPMNLPSDFDFFSTIHGIDERIPAQAVEFGADAIARVIAAYDAAPR
jgi:acetylornithine deacetylase/succinyl-diaminopimelate desuccinylase-like protein